MIGQWADELSSAGVVMAEMMALVRGIIIYCLPLQRLTSSSPLSNPPKHSESEMDQS